MDVTHIRHVSTRKPTSDLLELDELTDGAFIPYIKYLNKILWRNVLGLLPGLVFVVLCYVGLQLQLISTQTLIVQWGTIASAAYALYNLLRFWKASRIERVLADRLLEATQFVRHRWPSKQILSIAGQYELNDRLEAIARQAERLNTAVSSKHPAVEHKARSIAQFFRNLQDLVVQADVDTRDEILDTLLDDWRLLSAGRWAHMPRARPTQDLQPRVAQRFTYAALALILLGAVILVGISGSSWGIGQGLVMSLLAVLALSFLSKAGLELALFGTARDLVGRNSNSA